MNCVFCALGGFAIAMLWVIVLQRLSDWRTLIACKHVLGLDHKCVKCGAVVEPEL
jgi:hypothetical protein